MRQVEGTAVRLIKLSGASKSTSASKKKKVHAGMTSFVNSIESSANRYRCTQLTTLLRSFWKLIAFVCSFFGAAIKAAPPPELYAVDLSSLSAFKGRMQLQWRASSTEGLITDPLRPFRVAPLQIGHTVVVGNDLEATNVTSRGAKHTVPTALSLELYKNGESVYTHSVAATSLLGDPLSICAAPTDTGVVTRSGRVGLWSMGDGIRCMSSHMVVL